MAESGLPASDFDPADRPADWPTELPEGFWTVRLRLDCVDAQTGKPIDATWSLVGPSSASPPGYVEPENPPVNLSSLTDDRRRRAVDAAAVMIVDGSASGRLEIVAPAYADLRTGYHRFQIAPDAKELRFRAPVSLSVPLELTVLGPDGRPAEGAWISNVRIAGRVLDLPIVRADERGLLKVDGIPFLPGEVVQTYLVWRPLDAVGTIASEGKARPWDVESPVPSDPSRAWTTVVHLPGPVTSSDDDLRIEERPEPEDAFVARDADGARIGTVDPAWARGRVNVRCVDARGLPCPSAELEIEARHGDAIVDVTDGVQRLDSFTDEKGRRTFSRVPPDTIRVRARWGSRKGETIFDLRPGETKNVHVVLK